MQAPRDPDLELSVALLEIATRPWRHGADATLAQLEALRARGVPLERFEMRFGVNHPLLSSVGLQWTVENGPHYVVGVAGQEVVESAVERSCGQNPLYRDDRTINDEPWLLDTLPAALLHRLRDVRTALPAPHAIDVGARTGILVGGVDVGAPHRALMLFVPTLSAGFDAAHNRAIHTLMWGAAATMRGMRWRVLANVIATTYIGPRTGVRVVEGDLRRGQMERRTAVLWFSSLHGFADLSAQQAPEKVAETLNRVFEVLDRRIALAGGEILKILGDTILAVFPYSIEPEARDAVARATAAAHAVITQLPADPGLRIGLHRGEVAYGNVGSMERLDFTVVGETVNVVRRIQRLSDRLDAPVLASTEVAACAPEAWRSVGAHALTRDEPPRELFTPLQGTRKSSA